MIILRVQSGEAAGAEYLVRRFPISIGRSPETNLRLVGEGVWDRHAEIHLHQNRDFVAKALGEASVLHNGHLVEQAVLRNGDALDLGGVRLQFSLSPPVPKALRFREVLTWVGLGFVFVVQVALIYWLAG